jgi:hypothetical protein
MIWSASDIERIVSNIEFIIFKRNATNEHIPCQLTDYPNLLEKYLPWERPSYMDAEFAKWLQRHKFTDGARETMVMFIKGLKQNKILSCHCHGACKVPTEVDYTQRHTLEEEDPQKKDDDQQGLCLC